jgi:hypothetical protein
VSENAYEKKLKEDRGLHRGGRALGMPNARYKLNMRRQGLPERILATGNLSLSYLRTGGAFFQAHMVAAGVQPAVDAMCAYLEVVGYKPPLLKSEVLSSEVLFLDDAKNGLGWEWGGLQGRDAHSLSLWGHFLTMGHVSLLAMVTLGAIWQHDKGVWGQCRLQRLAKRDPADIDGTPEDESEVKLWPAHKEQLLGAIESAAQMLLMASTHDPRHVKYAQVVIPDNQFPFFVLYALPALGLARKLPAAYSVLAAGVLAGTAHEKHAYNVLKQCVKRLKAVIKERSWAEDDVAPTTDADADADADADDGVLNTLCDVQMVTARYFAGRGSAHDTAEALTRLNECLEWRPDDPELKRQRGHVRFTRGSWELAYQDFSYAVAQDPHSASPAGGMRLITHVMRSVCWFNLHGSEGLQAAWREWMEYETRIDEQMAHMGSWARTVETEASIAEITGLGVFQQWREGVLNAEAEGTLMMHARTHFNCKFSTGDRAEEGHEETESKQS